MANLTKTKTLFGFTSPRTLEKIIPEIGILTENFSGLKWSGNKKVQIDFLINYLSLNFTREKLIPQLQI